MVPLDDVTAEPGQRIDGAWSSALSATRVRFRAWASVCLALPETEEVLSREGRRQWKVRDKAFLWERPLRKKDVAELGDTAPDGPVLAAYVPDEGAKRALIAEEPGTYFTTSHFDGYPAVLCRLEELDGRALAELAAEAWACRAPRRLVTGHRFGPA